MKRGNIMEELYSKTKGILKTYKQEHLLLNYEKFNNENKKKLLKQISDIDFQLIKKLYEQTKGIEGKEENIIEPIKYIDKEQLTFEEKKYYEEKGKKEILNGKVAAVTMAGGQGTRLRT